MADDLKQLAAQQAGLRPELADRLKGETMTELLADAEKFAAAMPGAKAAPETPPMTVLDLARTDPDRFNALVESGEIDLTDPDAPAPLPEGQAAADAAAADPSVGQFDAGHRRSSPVVTTAAEFDKLVASDPAAANRLIETGAVNLHDLYPSSR